MKILLAIDGSKFSEAYAVDLLTNQLPEWLRVIPALSTRGMRNAIPRKPR